MVDLQQGTNAVFENWESEFLQMAAFVLLTVFLRQKGSPESKSISEKDGKEFPVTAASPWPVRRGGWVLLLYQNSLSIALVVLGIYLRQKDSPESKAVAMPHSKN